MKSRYGSTSPAIDAGRSARLPSRCLSRRAQTCSVTSGAAGSGGATAAATPPPVLLLGAGDGRAAAAAPELLLLLLLRGLLLGRVSCGITPRQARGHVSYHKRGRGEGRGCHDRRPVRGHHDACLTHPVRPGVRKSAAHTSDHAKQLTCCCGRSGDGACTIGTGKVSARGSPLPPSRLTHIYRPHRFPVSRAAAPTAGAWAQQSGQTRPWAVGGGAGGGGAQAPGLCAPVRARLTPVRAHGSHVHTAHSCERLRAPVRARGWLPVHVHGRARRAVQPGIAPLSLRPFHIMK
jgi:hypothetical protein